MVSRILSYYTNGDLNTTEPDVIELPALFAKILSICDPEGTIKPELLGDCKEMTSYSVVIELILLNLIVNALKYNDKGIKKEHLSSIFEPLKTLGVTDRFNQKGTGLGLSYVKRMVTKLGGEISVASELGVGSTFSFSVGKV